jgi:FKBP-type peptidyl-prolyl cis-trans isomerase
MKLVPALALSLCLSSLACRASHDPPDAGVPAAAPSASGAVDASVAITVLREGSGPVCEGGDRVMIHYTASLLDGTLVASSREKNKPLELTIGERTITAGMSQGVTGMRVGETRRLVVPPELAFGSKSGAKIPPYSTIVYEVELLAIKPK